MDHHHWLPLTRLTYMRILPQLQSKGQKYNAQGHESNSCSVGPSWEWVTWRISRQAVKFSITFSVFMGMINPYLIQIQQTFIQHFLCARHLCQVYKGFVILKNETFYLIVPLAAATVLSQSLLVSWILQYKCNAHVLFELCKQLRL